MKKRLYISMILATLSFCNNVHAISGAFYDSISNNSGKELWSGMEYTNGTDRWDGCGWWSNSGWTYYRHGNNCTTAAGEHKDIGIGKTVGQTGGHTSNYERTAAHQAFFVDSSKGTRGFEMWNDVNGKDDEHLYITMWCQGSKKVNFETKQSYNGTPALFVKTIFNKSTTTNKVDLGYIILKHYPQENLGPDMDIDLFNLDNNLHYLSISKDTIGYVKDCF